jgi:hypothetical protein
MTEDSTIRVPESSGKTSAEQLTSLEKCELTSNVAITNQPKIYHSDNQGFRFDFLWHPREGSDRLFVLFSGDAMRNKFDPPLFQRWTWASNFPGHCLFVSDPSLYLDPSLGLAWYAGTSTFDPMPVIAETVASFASQFDIPPERVWTYGSSGGGFAAVRMLNYLDGAGAVAVNPQTSICAYERKSVERYLKICFNSRSRAQALSDFPQRISLIENSERLSDRKLIYVQNVLDQHHFTDHYLPFISAMGAVPIEDNTGDCTPHFYNNKFCSILFSHPGGHKKAETPEVFTKILRSIFKIDNFPSEKSQ